MKTKFAAKAIILLLLIGIMAAAIVPIRFAHFSSAAWMAELDDAHPVRSLTIPGTHDSGALHSFAGLFGKCQTLKIPQQLDIGVRFLDLRLRLVRDELRIYHNFVEQKLKFEDVLEQLVEYVRQNPTEFLIVALKEERSPLRSEKQFSQVLEMMLQKYPDVVSSAASIPETVGDARGKIYILSRYDDPQMGIPSKIGWMDNDSFELNDMYIQDHYSLDSTEEKIADIINTASISASGKHKLVLNYISCTLNSGFPPSYSGTPAQIINPWFQQYLHEADGSLGVVICDFMTSELSQDIIGRNFK